MSDLISAVSNLSVILIPILAISLVKIKQDTRKQRLAEIEEMKRRIIQQQNEDYKRKVAMNLCLSSRR